MFCLNTQIICTDRIALEWQTGRKRKHERERALLGLHRCSIVVFHPLQPLHHPNPTVSHSDGSVTAIC